MAFAALLGGTLTLIGTPPNIVVNGALEDAGLEVFKFYSFTPIGLALLAGGILYLVTIGSRLLRKGESSAPEPGDDHGIGQLLANYDMKGRVLLLRVEASSSLVGRTLGEADLRTRTAFSVVAVQRSRRFGDDDVMIANQSTILRAGDALLVVAPAGLTKPGPPEGYGLVALGREALSGVLNNVLGVVEVVIAPRSDLRGKTIRELELRRTNRLHMLGIQHQGENVTEDPLDYELAMGDTVLLGGAWRDIDRLRKQTGKVLVLALPREWREIVPAFRRAPWALAIITAMMVLMVTGTLSAVISVLAAGMALVLTGCVTMPQAYRTISWSSVVLIAAMIPMSIALQVTGGAEFVANGMVDTLGDLGPHVLMAGIFLMTTALSLVISNSVTTVLMAPIVIQVGLDMGLSAQPLMMIVAVSASTAFLTPIGTTTNLMVSTPGDYRFSDFLRVGVPLIVIFIILSLLLIPVIWPL